MKAKAFEVAKILHTTEAIEKFRMELLVWDFCRLFLACNLPPSKFLTQNRFCITHPKSCLFKGGSLFALLRFFLIDVSTPWSAADSATVWASYIWSFQTECAFSWIQQGASWPPSPNLHTDPQWYNIQNYTCCFAGDQQSTGLKIPTISHKFVAPHSNSVREPASFSSSYLHLSLLQWQNPLCFQMIVAFQM